MSINIFDDKQIDLDLNGPILSFTTNPTGVGSTGVLSGGTGGGTVSLTGIATATFPTSSNNAGYVTYRWYEQGVGALSDGTYITGTATTTLTLSNLITPNDSGRKFYVEADYIPSYYVTGNATNDPLNSGIGTVTVDPLMEIVTQPTDVTVLEGADATFIIGASLTNGEDDLTYQWQLDGSDVSNGTVTKSSVITTVSGATSPTLVLNSDDSGITYTVNCVVSSASASNSPLTSDEVTFTPENVADFSIVAIEAIHPRVVVNLLQPPNVSIANTSEVDLENGEHTFTLSNLNNEDTLNPIQYYSFYAKEKDLDVEMDLYGGGTTSVGGEGGYSRIRFTMSPNEEFVIVGLIDSINTPFVYRRGALMACVGEGGKGGVVGKSGGDGGGVGVAGQDGFGIEGAGSGGSLIGNGQLTLNGEFGSAFQAPTLYPGDTQAGNNNGGRTIRCTKGVYLAQQGIPPCNDRGGLTKFRFADGLQVTNTAEITRGFKAGYNIMQTAGKGITAFRGGNGATGGEGGAGNDAGGGGGRGYSDGTVTVVSTRLGGSTGLAKVVLRIQS